MKALEVKKTIITTNDAPAKNRDKKRAAALDYPVALLETNLEK